MTLLSISHCIHVGDSDAQKLVIQFHKGQKATDNSIIFGHPKCPFTLLAFAGLKSAAPAPIASESKLCQWADSHFRHCQANYGGVSHKIVTPFPHNVLSQERRH